MSDLYEKIRRNNKPPCDITFISILASLFVITAFLIISVIYLMGCNRRFLAFVSNLSNSTVYANEHESLIAEINGKTYKISEKNMYGIYAYIALSKSGRESWKLPEGMPSVMLDYGDGAVLKLWDLPDDQSVTGNILFIYFTDSNGGKFSYINYKMTMETMMIRYLLYNNVEIGESFSYA